MGRAWPHPKFQQTTGWDKPRNKTDYDTPKNQVAYKIIPPAMYWSETCQKS